MTSVPHPSEAKADYEALSILEEQLRQEANRKRRELLAVSRKRLAAYKYWRKQLGE